eukprot:g8901.t1
MLGAITEVIVLGGLGDFGKLTKIPAAKNVLKRYKIVVSQSLINDMKTLQKSAKNAKDGVATTIKSLTTKFHTKGLMGTVNDVAKKTGDIVVDAGKKAGDIVVDAAKKTGDIVVDAAKKTGDTIRDTGKKILKRGVKDDLAKNADDLKKIRGDLNKNADELDDLDKSISRKKNELEKLKKKLCDRRRRPLFVSECPVSKRMQKLINEIKSLKAKKQKTQLEWNLLKRKEARLEEIRRIFNEIQTLNVEQSKINKKIKELKNKKDKKKYGTRDLTVEQNYDINNLKNKLAETRAKLKLNEDSIKIKQKEIRILIEPNVFDAISKANRAIDNHITDKDLRGASIELNGGIVGKRPDGKPWNHIDEVTNAQTSIDKALTQINEELKVLNTKLRKTKSKARTKIEEQISDLDGHRLHLENKLLETEKIVPRYIRDNRMRDKIKELIDLKNSDVTEEITALELQLQIELYGAEGKMENAKVVEVVNKIEALYWKWIK